MNRQNDERNSKGKSTSLVVRKWLRFFHVLFSLSWFGGVLALGVLIFFIPKPDSTPALVYKHIIFSLIDHILVAPTAVLSLVTGLLLCWKTRWGFFRYWWVVVKLTVTTAVIIFCTLVTAPIDQELIELGRKLGMEALQNEAYLNKKMLGAMVNPFNIVLLIFLTYLSVFKPWGKRSESTLI